MSDDVVAIGVFLFGILGTIIFFVIAIMISKKEKEKLIRKMDDKYMNFPKLEKEIKEIEEKITEKYDRITMDYIDVSYIEFEMYERRVEDYGFEKNSNVRYDKNNTYVILEYNEKRQQLHVVFHIKAF